ncbi:hypothetical protein VTL71DRAFT_16236, partial [Oculimacula yallundae]
MMTRPDFIPAHRCSVYPSRNLTQQGPPSARCPVEIDERQNSRIPDSLKRGGQSTTRKSAKCALPQISETESFRISPLDLRRGEEKDGPTTTAPP